MFVVTTVTFFIIRLLPGDPVFLWVGNHPTSKQLETARKNLGYNEPLHKQYISFLNKITKLDFGVSLRTRQPVAYELKKRFAATFELVFFSILAALILGFPMGILSAIKERSLFDYIIRGIGYVGLSLPVFWLGMILQIVFFGMLHLLPLQGRYDSAYYSESTIIGSSGFILIDSFFSAQWGLFFNGLQHIILPATTMAFGVLGVIVRTARSAMLETINEPFFKTFMSYGFDNIEITKESAYKNILIPVSTVAGLSFGLMLGGTFLVESIFDWPGLGQFSVLSILTSDFPAIIGITFLYTFTYVIINFLIDVFYALIDPRIHN